MKETGRKLTGWLLIIAGIISACLIYFFKQYNLVYLLINIALLITAGILHKGFNAGHVNFSRYLLGVVFIFSGFVKGVDPVGTQYQIEDYFIAYGTEWARTYALILSVIVNSFEFILGVLLLFNVRMKFTAWLLLLIMALFTVTTVNDALYNPVPDCGCFGDAIKMTNWQTLYKNLVINLFVIVIFSGRARVKSSLKPGSQIGIFLAAVIVFIGFEIYNIRHLPLIDFRDWKEGKNMVIENPIPKETYVSFRNKSTGEIREYLSPDYPFNDSVWMSQWEFIDSRTYDPNPRLHNLHITDSENQDVTSLIIENPDFQIIFVSFDLEKMNLKNLDRIKGILTGSDSLGVSSVFLTSTLPEIGEQFIHEKGLDTYIYFADDTELQAMIRSNPGLVLMRGGTVISKWHKNDIPGFDELLNEYLKK